VDCWPRLIASNAMFKCLIQRAIIYSPKNCFIYKFSELWGHFCRGNRWSTCITIALLILGVALFKHIFLNNSCADPLCQKCGNVQYTAVAEAEPGLLIAAFWLLSLWNMPSWHVTAYIFCIFIFHLPGKIIYLFCDWWSLDSI